MEIGCNFAILHFCVFQGDDFAAALAQVGTSKSKKSLYSNALQSEESEDSDGATFGGYPVKDVYSHQFITKPFGMEWKTTKTDKKNLYVSKVAPDSQAEEGGVVKGSKLLSFNGEMIENLGAKKIYGKLADADLPMTITFLKPKTVSKPNVLSAVKSDSEGTPEPPRAPSGAPPGDSPRAIANTDAGLSIYCGVLAL